MNHLESSYILLDNQKGLKGVFSTLGAGVRSLSLDDKPLILQMKDEQTYLQSPQLFGKTVSRYIGRIPSKGEIDGVPYSLEEFEPGMCLHGGYFKSMIFKNYDAEFIENEQSVQAVFSYLSPDLDCGFPGNLRVKVTYLFSKDRNIFTIKYEAVSDKDTLISLSNHMYWNLSQTDDVNSYLISVNASKYGAFAKGTQMISHSDPVLPCLDLTKPRFLGEVLDQIEKDIPQIGTLDHTFLFDRVTDVVPQVTLENSHYKIECYTDFDAVNLYVDSTKNPVDFVNNPNLKEHVRRGIAIEPQQSVLDHFILKANQVYSHYITYRIYRK